ncbi:MAG: ArsC family reductase [Gammaproteobacteria bacterium]|nr:ArsC family reductase [Gammaproteobacteria bacterium]
MTRLYGIKNCDTVKKARNYLDKLGVDYVFHDYRSEGLSQDQLQIWVNALGWDSLLNKRSTTWRQLPDSIKDNIDQTSAVQVMLDQPTVIKRPVLELNSGVYLGFSARRYDDLFSGQSSLPD